MTSWQKQLPMHITWFRILMTPVIVFCLWPNQLNWNIAASVFFIIASISDYFDGYFARKFDAITNMGKFMDPIADKILITSILVVLIPTLKVDPFMVILILVRDTFIGGIRSVAAADGIVISAKSTGKWKTALQMIAIPAIIIGDPIANVPLEKLGYWGLWSSVVLSVISGFQYYWNYSDSRKST